MESRSNAARKLSVAVLGVTIDHSGECRGTLDPALTAVLRLARSDGDATVRCAAFDCVTEYMGETYPCHINRTSEFLLPCVRAFKENVLLETARIKGAWGCATVS